MRKFARYALWLTVCALGGAPAVAGEGIAKVKTVIRRSEVTRLVAPGEWIPYY